MAMLLGCAAVATFPVQQLLFTIACCLKLKPLLLPIQVGLVHSTRLGEDDSKTLKQLNFQTGDFLGVAIY